MTDETPHAYKLKVKAEFIYYFKLGHQGNKNPQKCYKQQGICILVWYKLDIWFNTDKEVKHSYITTYSISFWALQF